jgi:VWFA-related protein
MRTGIGRAIAVAAASVTLLAAGGAVLAEPQRGAEQPPVFRGGIDVVTIDVGVVDKQGLPMRGLTAADFFVTVDGKPRRVVSAEFVDRSAILPADLGAADADRVSTNEGGHVGRLLAFVVDQSTLDIAAVRRVADDASALFSGLTFADRSALTVLPTGPRVGFTWAHDRVRAALQRTAGTGRPSATWEHGTLAEARDIASRSSFALSAVGERVCGPGSVSGFGSAQPFGGQGGTSTPGPGGTGTTPTGPATGGSGAAGRTPGNLSGFGMNACVRDLQTQADTVWRTVEITSLSSLAALRQMFRELERTPGDKTIVLISGGWPLAQNDEVSLLSLVAEDAAAARATLFTIFVPGSTVSADRGPMSRSPGTDTFVYAGPLENLAAMTGGISYRAEISAAPAFERIMRELSAQYRLGIEKTPVDLDDEIRRVKVQVRRSGARVRAREIFDARTYADRDWAARLGAAIDGPAVATDLGIRMTSYLATNPDRESSLSLLVSGEVSRARPGQATMHLLVSDVGGKEVTAGQRQIAYDGDEAMFFAANVAVPPGDYIVRVGVIDSAGRVGSADHRVHVRGAPLGAFTATGPVLTRVPSGGAGEPRLVVDGVGRDERLVLEVGIEGEPQRIEDAEVQFEIAAAGGGPALLQAPATLSNGSRTATFAAQAVAQMRVLPPGPYLVRARVTAGGETLGEVHRAFTVLGVERPAKDAGSAATAGGYDAGSRASVSLPLVSPPPFALDQVLSPPVLGVFLDRLAARPDASAPEVRALIERARTSGPRDLAIPPSLASATPVAAFLEGLMLLSRHQLEPAALAFRDAMRVSADISPAMVYLGACYAAGGKDKEAAAVWRTALIREGDAAPVHRLLAGALLRQGRADLAIDDLSAARTRWPEDEDLARQHVTAALLGGRQIDGMEALDAAIARQADDEPTLALALYMLYLAFEIGEPIEGVSQDRERMLRLAQRYRARGGPAIALVEAWVSAVTGKR